MTPARHRLPRHPTITPEKRLSAECGGGPVAGVDEAGRGPIAGPVVAAAVIWDFDRTRPRGLGDSKLLSARERERLFPLIQRHALAHGIGIATAAEIDALNILEATRLAARRALAQLTVAPIALVTDALEIPGCGLRTLPLIKGDRRSASIAAASILAKVTRDRMMDAYHREFPAYGWDSNRGYPTADHYRAVGELGPTVLHRLTFAGVGFFAEEPLRSPSFHRLAKLMDATPPTPDAWRAMREQITLAGEALPPPDAALLDRLWREGARGAGLEPESMEG